MAKNQEKVIFSESSPPESLPGQLFGSPAKLVKLQDEYNWCLQCGGPSLFTVRQKSQELRANTLSSLALCWPVELTRKKLSFAESCSHPCRAGLGFGLLFPFGSLAG